jgi:hypothetical protein
MKKAALVMLLAFSVALFAQTQPDNKKQDSKQVKTSCCDTAKVKKDGCNDEKVDCCKDKKDTKKSCCEDKTKKK